MATLNEAYRVLRDPTLRSRYDADLRQLRSSAARPGGARPTRTEPARITVPHRADPSPARYPWKLVVGMAVLGATVVLVGAALYEPAPPDVPDNVLQPGSCVAIELNGDAREVNCGSADDVVVQQLVPMDSTCPAALSAHRDRQGMGIACVSRRI